MPPRLTLLRGLAGVALVSALAPVSAQTIVTRSSDGLVKVEATALPLRAVLSAFVAIEPLDIRLDPAVADRPITVSLTGLRHLSALARVLDESGLDYIISTRPGSNGSILVVWAGDLKAAIPLDARDDAGDEPPAAQVDSLVAAAPGPDIEDPEKEDIEDADPGAEGGAVGLAAAPPGRALGEVTASQILALITPPGGRPLQQGPVQLPFLDANGNPIVVMRSGVRSSVITLPFPDATGQPLIQHVTPQAVPPGFVALPFPGPDGQPLLVPIQAPPPAPGPTAPPSSSKGTSKPGQIASPSPDH